MRIGILGGSFDPPHVGHSIVANHVLKYTPIQEVLLMPCFKHAFNKKLTPAKDRLRMVKSLEVNHIKVSDYEIKKKEISLSIETLRFFKKKYPTDSFFWIIGSDQLPDFHKWDNWQEMLTLFGLVIVPRSILPSTLENQIKQYLYLNEIPSNIFFINNPDVVLTNISSTLIRERIQSRKSIADLVHKNVEKYIYKYKLYT